MTSEPVIAGIGESLGRGTVISIIMVMFALPQILLIGSKVIDNEATSAGTGALDQFVGKSGAGTLVVKQNIDAVTGATVSTKGVTKGVNAALAAAEAMN